MKYDTAGVYEIPLSATDECANETVEEREVLVARNVIAGDNITLEQDGNNVTINADVCGALDECQTITDMQTEIEGKQDELTAGQNITIENNVISSSGEEYTAGQNVQIENGVISATDTTYSAGQNVSIDQNNEISVDLSDYYDKGEVDTKIQTVETEVAGKQDALTAGNNITIEGNVISADDPDLSDYYEKSETYNKTEVNDLISAIEDFHVEIVQSLPQTGEERTIYFVPKQGGGYTEYMYINNDWEEIGDTDIDLSNYYTKSETNNLLDDKVDKVAGKGLSTNNYTNEDKAIVDSVPATYATKDEISAFLSCDTLGNCQTISDMQDAIDGKQDVLTAGSHITIAQDGTISATGMTKAEILAELGYAEIPMSIKDTNNVETKVMVLGRVVE